MNFLLMYEEQNNITENNLNHGLWKNYINFRKKRNLRKLIESLGGKIDKSDKIK